MLKMLLFIDKLKRMGRTPKDDVKGSIVDTLRYLKENIEF